MRAARFTIRSVTPLVAESASVMETANAVLLLHAMRFNLDATASEQTQIALAMGAAVRPDEAAANRAADAVADFSRRIGAPARLRDLGGPRDQLRAEDEIVRLKRTFKDWFRLMGY